MKLKLVLLFSIIILLVISLAFYFNGYPFCTEGWIEKDGECVLLWELANNDK